MGDSGPVAWNHLFNRQRHGYTGTSHSRDKRPGMADGPLRVNWLQHADKSHEAVEAITRQTVGTPQCPIPGLPHEEVMV